MVAPPGRWDTRAATAVLLVILAGRDFSRMASGAVVQFIFGDSLSDVGNNNYLSKSLSRAVLPWYGIDFGDGMPNGRFTNGRTVADIVGDKMGLPRPPAFLDPTVTTDMILQKGLNYASGGAGILNETSSFFVQRLPLTKQIELFQGTQRMIRLKIGEVAADEFFRESLYVVALGSNDFINNFLLPLTGDSWAYDGDTFIDYLTSTLKSQLTLLHSLGARKLTFFGLGPIGCIPLQRFMTSSGDCRESPNNLAISFNSKAAKLLEELSGTLPNATFRFGDAYDIVQDVIDNPVKYGFNNSETPCCSLGRIRPTLTCTPLSTLCTDRSKYVFWDEYHPTESANEVIANELSRKLGLVPVNAAGGGS